VYITNDLLDLPDDRKHKEKSTRPFAAGDIPVIQGLLLAPLLFFASCLISFYFLPLDFLLIMLGYFCLTFFYSLYLKRLPIVDVVVLAFLYTVRIIAGAIVIDSDISFWLLAFSTFIFLRLALIKRYSEIRAIDTSDSINTVAGRGYLRSDLGLLSQFGIASGYISVLVFSLYINSEKVLQLYTNPEFLWCICMILLFWTSRIWLLAGRGLVNEDPILFAIKDKISAISGVIVASLIAISI
jgi:4-hydroxybenzoate polyprenyltransferase